MLRPRLDLLLMLGGVCCGLTTAAPAPSSSAPDSSLQVDSVTAPPLDVDSLPLEPVLMGLGRDTILITAYSATPGPPTGQPSPTRALLRSMVFPGWGQYSNGRHFKAALVLAVESYLVYKAVALNADASDWKDRWRETDDDYLKIEYFKRYADYRDRRNSHLWYMVLTVFLSMFDAYVDAHLAPFPEKIVKPEETALNFDWEDGVRVSLEYRF